MQEAVLSSSTDTEFMSSKEKYSHSYWIVQSAVPVQNLLAGTSDDVDKCVCSQV